MIRRVLVLGGGSAGYIAALTLKRRLPTLNVAVIRSNDLGVIGVGESTTVAIPNHLHGYLGLDPCEFYRVVQPSWKLGIRFLWGPRPFFDYSFGLQMDWKWNVLAMNNGFYCRESCEWVNIPSSLMSLNKSFARGMNGVPLIGRDYGYHIDNKRFVAYLERKASELGISSIDGVVSDVTQDERGVTALRLDSGMEYQADLYVDCSGFRSLLLGSAFAEGYTSFKTTLLCDRAVVGSWIRRDEVIKPYTTAETMNAGWCWQIDHPDSIMRGYVYSSSFISDTIAEEEFRAKNPRIESTRVIKFASGRYHRSWVKNVVAIGNSAGFVEPLESTSLAVICDESRLVAEALFETAGNPSRLIIENYNKVNARVWDTIRDFLGIHYKYNTRYDNHFWKQCQTDVELGCVQNLVRYYEENGPSTFARTTLLANNDIFGMEGYLALLVGQKVPYRRCYHPSAEESAAWNAIRQNNKNVAVSALTVREALDIVMSPAWTWNPAFFGHAPSATHQLTSFIGPTAV